MAADRILVIDAGTSGVRAVVTAPDGSLTVARRAWEYESPPEIGPLGRSFDSETFWSLIRDAVREALSSAGGEIAAVATTSQRLAMLIVDAEGRQLYAGPNSDVRALGQGLAIDAAMAGRVYESGGKLPSLLLGPARVQWLRQTRPDGFARAAAVLTLGDWVAYKLTGAFRNERALAGDMGLLDVRSGERDGDLLRALDVPEALLPPLVSPADVAGEVTERASNETGLRASTPVVIAGSDTQCGLVGLGVETPGEAGIIAGWSAPVQLVTPEPRPDAQRRTWFGLHVVPGRWVIESSTGNAGAVWRWWCETLLGCGEASLAQADELAAQASPGANDVIALLGSGVMNAGAMGLHLGGVLFRTPLASAVVRRPELLRAGLEDIAYALRGNLEQAEDVSGLRATRIAAGGGMTRSPLFTRILADVLDRPLEVAREIEVTATGAATLAARAVGRPELAPERRLDAVEPSEQAAAYRAPYARWRMLSSELDETMRRLP